MRFLVFSDLHLDHAFEDVGPHHAARRPADLRACLDRILALADTHEVDAILSAGDLYEHRHLQPETASFLVDRFGQAGRPVFLAPGDEDPHTPDSLYATTPWPANVHVFDKDLLVPVELADGFRLWGAAHLGHGDTTGFLDGFRITDDAVNLALFHGSEVGTSAHDPAPVVAPFRAEQIEHAGLTHAFVGNSRAAVDTPWHTVPGTPHPLGVGEPDLRGVVIVDVAPDGSLKRQRFGVADSPVHEVIIDLTDAGSTDEVLERMIASVEDLQGTVHVSLHGQPAPDVVVLDEDITSWSTGRLEIVLAPQPAAPPHRDVERPASVAPPVRRDTPSPETVLEVTAAHDAWQEALASLRRHAREEPAPVERPDLGGMTLDTLETHLQTLRTHPAALEPDPAAQAPHPEASPARRESRPRAIGRAVAALVTVGSAIGLLLVGETVLERGVAVAALVMVVGMAVITQRLAVDDAELAASRDRVRATLLLGTELSTASAQARHAATAALRQAGLPTSPDELAALVEAARHAAAQQDARTAWEQRRADLATRLEEATSHLRSALQRGGIAETLDVEGAWARFQARADHGHPMAIPGPQ